MARGTKPTVFQDLDHFLQMADFLRNGQSLRKIGTLLKPSTSVWGVRDILDRLESTFRTQLVARATKASGDNQLTPEGEALLARVRDLFAWRPNVSPPVRVGISQSLLTSQLFTPPLEMFLRKSAGDRLRPPDLQVAVRPVMDIERVLLDVQTRDLDIAIVWGVEQRMRPSAGLIMEPLPSPFDLVLIARDKSVLDSLYSQSANMHQVKWDSVNKERLAELRFIVMGPNDQAQYDELPMPDPTKGGARVEVGSIDIIIALVRARVGDVGLVPAIYSELDRFRGDGELYYSPPLDRELPLALIMRRPGFEHLSVDAKNFVTKIRTHLARQPNQSVWNTEPKQNQLSAEFPDDATFYEGFRFGYYIDIDREGKDIPKWKWQQVEISEANAKSDLEKGFRFRGRIKNSFEVRFNFHGELLGNKFCIWARQPGNHGKDVSIHDFISVFTLCSPLGWMFGMWIGNDSKFPSGQFATLWSHKRLDLDRICEIARAAKTRWLHNVSEGHEFEKQPE